MTQTETQIQYLRTFERLIVQSSGETHPEHVRGILVSETRGWSTECFARGIRAASSVVEKDTDRRKEGILK